MAKLTEAELDDWAAAWHAYFDGVLARHRRRQSDADRIFERQAEANQQSRERLAQRRWERLRAERGRRCS